MTYKKGTTINGISVIGLVIFSNIHKMMAQN